MNTKNAPSILRDNFFPQQVDRARQHWETRRLSGAQRDASSQAPAAFTVAISREVGTEGTSVAREVGRRLGWQVYDRELIEHVAKEMGLRTALLDSVDEKTQSWLLELVQGFVTGPANSEWGTWVDENAFVQHLVKTVLALGSHGNCVIVGRGAAFILPPENTLRVRLMAPLPARIAALGRKLGVSEREAARAVRNNDRERTDFVYDHFRKDPADPRNFDLILNTSRLSVDQCAGVIAVAIRHCEAQEGAKISGKAASS